MALKPTVTDYLLKNAEEQIGMLREELAPLEDGSMHTASKEAGQIEWTDTTADRAAYLKSAIATYEGIISRLKGDQR